MAFSFQTRDSNLKTLESTEDFDLVIIGGGINGAGAARDAASRGMKVALIEANDFASGTSSRSSKLIHGGIRYLENMEFGLVFEALSERRHLFEMAPHLVHPLRFVLPLYKGGRVGMFKLGLGMLAYDALSMFEAPELHKRLSKDAALEKVPMLKEQDLLGGYAYSDAYMDDDRLVIETLRSAHRMGACLVNFCSAEGGELKDGKLTRIKAKDQKSGREFWIRGRHFISTVGAWTDIVTPKLLGEWKKKLRPSKGVHLTLDRSRIPLKDAVVMISDDEKRIVFGIPRHEMIIIGTTDTDYPGDPTDVRADKDDIDYLLHVADQYFPQARITRKDILANYSGVRPLVHDGAETESKTSREHTIILDPRNVTFVMGGKYTTYRLISEQTVDKALEAFTEEERREWKKPNTTAPLNPLVTPDRMARARIQTNSIAEEFHREREVVEALVERHGEEAIDILKAHPKANGRNILWALEAEHAISETMCLSLVDFYVRRTPLFLSRRDHGLLMLNEIAKVFQSRFGWSEAEKNQQVNALHEYIQSEMQALH